jgi:anthranilate phosphoribosyltransferase
VEHTTSQIEALFESDGFFYLQMPYYANGTLATLHERMTLTARSLLELLLPLAHAVAHLDALGVLHSDIK